MRPSALSAPRTSSRSGSATWPRGLPSKRPDGGGEYDVSAGTCLEGTPDCDDSGILGDDATGATPAAGMCAPDIADCDDTPGQAEPSGDAFDRQAAIIHAEVLLGLSEPELELGDRVDVRIGRRGEERMMLIENYLLGRMTVELDIDDMDEWIVTAVTVELPDGPQTVTHYVS